MPAFRSAFARKIIRCSIMVLEFDRVACRHCAKFRWNNLLAVYDSVNRWIFHTYHYHALQVSRDLSSYQIIPISTRLIVPERVKAETAWYRPAVLSKGFKINHFRVAFFFIVSCIIPWLYHTPAGYCTRSLHCANMYISFSFSLRCMFRGVENNNHFDSADRPSSPPVQRWTHRNW